MREPALQLTALTKRFGAMTAVDALDLVVAQGEFVTLLGPSGCGKTTTLNMIAGFLTPDAGSISLQGRAVQSLPPFRRDLGLVFQDYALFPHMTVAENVGFGLRMRRVARDEIERRVAEALELVQLSGLGERRPLQLSGGQRQRVALARALVIRPAMLLLDEPLSNLDLKLREEMRVEISALQRRLGIATVFVTHDQGEALTMSDRIAVMREGHVEQIGTPADIYERPATRFVAGFIGSINMLPARRVAVAPDGLVGVQTAVGPATVRVASSSRPMTDIILAIRPERLKLSAAGDMPADATCWPARVERMVYLGARIEMQILLSDGSMMTVDAMNDGNTAWSVGSDGVVWFRPDDGWLIDVG
jgi:putative spermidine/putrescine transport system ATP-binding protein